ncbi:coiled-coil domain-containing protein [Nitrococcus mobilis]|uniref:Uncharacterized protein n=1 Tax=Nitrococcus mobilis Nb-231 TaxID=314278 RepID=A4BRU0_9GAMM|nr:hypothetical protein [Nitrococcus mobilis]EAR21661.1 hypothetical protein NB231_02803 [Nitrococcus mobilis Nb-231]
MSDNRMLITLGTPFGTWARLAEHLRQQAPQVVLPAAPAFSAWHGCVPGISALNDRPDPEAIAMSRFDLNVGPNLAIPAEIGIHLQENKIDSDLRSGIRSRFLQGDGAEPGFSRSPAVQAGGDSDGIDMRACWPAEVWAELSSVAEFLIFFEPPERTLAHWLAADEAVDSDALLQAWRVGAERILRLVRRYRRRVLLVDAREAAAYPARLLDVCGERFGIAFAGEAGSAPDLQSDAAFVALASSWIRPDKRLRAIGAELEVSCIPLTADAPTGDGIAGIPQADPLAALAQYRAVHRQCDTFGREAERLAAELEQAQGVTAAAEAALEEERAASRMRMANAEAERDRLREQGEQAQQEAERERADLEAKLKASTEAVTKAKAAEAEVAASLKAERESTARLITEHKIEGDRLRVHGEQAQQENELLLLQLHQVQEELEATFLAQQETERKRADFEAKLKASAEAVTKAKAAEAEVAASLKAERESTARLITEHKIEGDRLREHSEQAQQENELLLLQLHQVQEELEATFLAQQETERKRADFEAKLKASAEAVTKAKAAEAEVAASLKAEREGAARLVAEHKIERDRLRAHSEQSERKRAELETKLKESADALAKLKIAQAEATKTLHAERERNAGRVAELEAERGRLRTQAEAASPDPELRQENELLLLQLHQVQEELEHYFLENQKLKGRAETNQTKPQLQALQVADIQIAGVCEEAPFHHLNFSLRDVTQGPRRFDALDVRLVEHHGEPGLVVFTAREGVAPLSSWTESGKEQDRAFMLLHPQHKTSKALFARMTASDWLLINDLAALMQTTLRNAADARPRLAARWGLVCQRLREQLAELPPVLRYDRAQVAHIADAAGKLEITLRLGNAMFQQRAYFSLCVRLCLSGGSGVRADLPASLVFLAPAERGTLPPLSIWPLTDAGDWAQEHALRFGKGLSGAKKRAQWQALDSHDREFVASLLYGLPAALAESWEVVPPAGLGHVNVSLLADKMAREIDNNASRAHDSRTPVLRRVVG